MAVEFHFWLLPFFSVVILCLGTLAPAGFGLANMPLVRNLTSESTHPDVTEGSGDNWSRAVSPAASQSPRDVAKEQGSPDYHTQAHAATPSAQTHFSRAGKAARASQFCPRLCLGEQNLAGVPEDPQGLPSPSGKLTGRTVRLARREALVDSVALVPAAG